ncbi:hypothetical protein Tco_0067328 [Tanacetum coccineum]
MKRISALHCDDEVLFLWLGEWNLKEREKGCSFLADSFVELTLLSQPVKNWIDIALSANLLNNFVKSMPTLPDGDERKAANLDQRLKSLILSVLPNDQMNSVINCLTAKSTWDDLILYHEGPSDVKESKVMDLKLCYNTFKYKKGETLTQTFTRHKALMNELVNDGIKLSKLEINTGFINGLPKKWLSFCQSLRNTNHVKESKLVTLFGKLKYEENLIDSIYETEKKKSLATKTPLSTAFFSTSIIQDFQDSPDDKEDTRSSQDYLIDLEEEYQEGDLLAKSKRFLKKWVLKKPKLRPNKDFEAKYNKVKAKLALLSSGTSSKSLMVKNKGLFAEAYEGDEEYVSYDDNEMTEVKVLIAVDNDKNSAIGKESAKNGEWVKISMRKVHTLLEMEENDERKTFLDYLCNDLNYVEEQRSNLILKENQNLRKELKGLTDITKTWLKNSNNLNQCISEQIPTQKKRILGVDQLTKDPSSSEQKDLVFIKSSSDDTKVILTSKSQINITNPSIVVTDSSATNYDSADESLVCSTPLPRPEKIVGAEPVSGPKTIKLILKSNSIFKAETLKGVIINEPSLVLAKGNKSVSSLKINSAPAGKLKNVKTDDGIPLAIVMKELNDLKL